MKRPPRSRNTAILSRRLLERVVFSASIILVGVLFILAREMSDGSTGHRDQTMVRGSLHGPTFLERELTFFFFSTIVAEFHLLRLPGPRVRSTKSWTQCTPPPRKCQPHPSPDRVRLFHGSTLSHLLPSTPRSVPNRSSFVPRFIGFTSARGCEYGAT